MKKIFKGITYDTGDARLVAVASDTSATHELYQDRNGRFFLFKRVYFLGGKPLHKGAGTWEFLPALAPNPSAASFRRAQKRVTCRESIKPMTRREAFNWNIRELLPRTFHKELNRFLK